MTTYSTFFSSGLLAATRHASFDSYDSYAGFEDPCPLSPSSPLPDSDIEIDGDRISTRTPVTTSHSFINSSTTNPPRPRLRKRKSSLTVGCSPMNAIRSPARNAGVAFQLQMHPRSRSGSVTNAPTTDLDPNSKYSIAVGLGIRTSNLASEGTSLVGRMRSGSVGGAFRWVTFLSKQRKNKYSSQR